MAGTKSKNEKKKEITDGLDSNSTTTPSTMTLKKKERKKNDEQ